MLEAGDTIFPRPIPFVVSTNQFPEVYTKSVQDHRGINVKVTTQLLSQKSAPNSEQSHFLFVKSFQPWPSKFETDACFGPENHPNNLRKLVQFPLYHTIHPFLIDIIASVAPDPYFSQHFLLFFSLKGKSLHFHHLSKRPNFTAPKRHRKLCFWVPLTTEHGTT